MNSNQGVLTQIDKVMQKDEARKQQLSGGGEQLKRGNEVGRFFGKIKPGTVPSL